MPPPLSGGRYRKTPQVKLQRAEPPLDPGWMYMVILFPQAPWPGWVLCDIAAFETADGLVIHRIVRAQQSGTSVRLLQMADVDLHASWVEEHAVIGRITTLRHQNREIYLQHPIAQRCGNITARLRYQLYLWKLNKPLRILSRLCSRWVVLSSNLWIRCWCTTLVNTDETSSIYPH